MESLAHVNVLLAAYGGLFLAIGAQLLVNLDSSGLMKDARFVELRVLGAALTGAGAALLLLPLLAARAAHAARAPRRALYICFACAMAALIVGEVAALSWLAYRGWFPDPSEYASTLYWVWLGLLGLLAVLELAALALGALLASRAAGPCPATRHTSWQRM